MDKIKIPNEFGKRMKAMQKEYSVIFLAAHTGAGKTSVVRKYLESRKIAYTYVSSEQDDFAECIKKARSNVIVIDDFQNIGQENEEYLKSHFYDMLHGHKFFILSRASMPSWLKVYQIIGQVGYIDKSILFFSEQDMKEYLEMNQIRMTDSELYRLHEETQSYPLALKCMVSRIQAGTDMECMGEKIMQDIFDYYDESVVQNWSRELYTFMLQVGGFERFSLGLASMVSGYPDVQKMIDEINRRGSFIEKEKEEYIIEPFFNKYLVYKQKKELSETAIRNIYYNAGLYYELQTDIKSALKYYSKCGNEDKVQELLIRNASLHPGIAYYLEVEEYYRAFPKEKILKNPDLMSGMCMLCSLNIQVEESEYWYNELKNYFENLKKIDFEYKYVKGRLYWLDISLPHRGSASVEKLILNAVAQKKNKDMVLGELSVTSNLPSVLNGGKDFSIWVPKADMMYPVMKAAMPIAMGEAGQGLADICMAEKMLEQADENTYQIIDYINSGIYEASAKGKLETRFVGAALMYRLYLAQGNTETAYNLMMDFKKQVDENQQKQLLLNLNALMAGHYLKIGKKEQVEIWLKEAPNENNRFNVFERYRYMVKARVYISQQKYTEGISLLNRMIQYGINYDRTIIRIQARILLAIILYRIKNENWKEILEEALLEAQKYQYIQMIADEGAAVLPLLQETNVILEKEYKKKLMQQVKAQAMIYPVYLKADNVNIDVLTITEKQVLKLLGRGMKNKEISEFMNISLNTVAYHTKNIYQKLGVNNRTQATNIAKEME